VSIERVMYYNNNSAQHSLLREEITEKNEIKIRYNALMTALLPSNGKIIAWCHK